MPYSNLPLRSPNVKLDRLYDDLRTYSSKDDVVIYVDQQLIGDFNGEQDYLRELLIYKQG